MNSVIHDKGYIDLQVNGYGGIDFNAEALSFSEIRQACEALQGDGVAAILATVVTDDVEVMEERLHRLAEACSRDRLVSRMIYGLHVEGPFINPAEGYRGAHPASSIRPASVEITERLLSAGDGRVKMVTLAPEFDEGLGVIRYLSKSGVLVAAGHTDASYETLKASCDAGLSLFTHLGNGCPAEIPRHDNIIERALALRDRLYFSLITDGVHIPFFALGNYISLIGFDRAIVVTDAMAAAGMGSGRFRIGRMEIEVGEDRAVRQPDSQLLAGAAVTMPVVEENLTRRMGFSAEQVSQLTRDNPQRLLHSLSR